MLEKAFCLAPAPERQNLQLQFSVTHCLYGHMLHDFTDDTGCHAGKSAFNILRSQQRVFQEQTCLAAEGEGSYL